MSSISTIGTGNTDLSTSSEYSRRFATVLSNARASDADPAKIYQAFASPITSRDATPEAMAPAAESFDYRWLAMFAAGAALGALVAALLTTRKKRTKKAARAD